VRTEIAGLRIEFKTESAAVRKELLKCTIGVVTLGALISMIKIFAK
jgi:hypothetical protein